MYLGIEIGGTKLQFGVGAGDAQLVVLERLEIEPARGAERILGQIADVAPRLIQAHHVQAVGVGFGGPVETATGRVIKSHQVPGWEAVSLAGWCQQILGRPAVIGNDCDVAALAEATWGAGCGKQSVFYVTAGTGVGGGCVVGGRVFGEGRPAIAEIGHLRPGLHAEDADMTVESLASGTGIAAAARARVLGDVALPLDRFCSAEPRETWGYRRRRVQQGKQLDEEYRRDLLQRVDGDLDQLTARLVARAAVEGNELAADVLRHATQALGWAIAQVITLLAPEVVVVGGGVSLMGEALFLAPLRDAVRRYVFPPLADTYEIQPARLGEEVVVHGAIALARQRTAERTA